jgi:hypothetical protein
LRLSPTRKYVADIGHKCISGQQRRGDAERAHNSIVLRGLQNNLRADHAPQGIFLKNGFKQGTAPKNRNSGGKNDVKSYDAWLKIRANAYAVHHLCRRKRLHYQSLEFLTLTCIFGSQTAKGAQNFSTGFARAESWGLNGKFSASIRPQWTLGCTRIKTKKRRVHPFRFGGVSGLGEAT